MKITTLKFIMAVGAVVAAWQAKVMSDDSPGNTISATVRDVAETQTGIVVLWALLTGHLFSKHLNLVYLFVTLGAMYWPIFDAVSDAVEAAQEN